MANLFNGYKFRGKHATYAKFLATERGAWKDNRSIVLTRIVDVYMLGAIVGFVNHSKSKIDDNSNDSSDIPTSVMMNEQHNLEFIYRLILLLDESEGLSEKERIDRAFKTDADEQQVRKNMELFNSYVLGGVEILYEMFADTVNDNAEKVRKMLDLASMLTTSVDEIEEDDYLVA